MRTGKRELLDYLQDILYAIERAERIEGEATKKIPKGDGWDE